MAEKQTAEDDDEEGFGDFTFAAISPSPSVISHITTSKNLEEEEEDDEWGDFIDNSPAKRFHLPGGISTTRSHPIDPFDFSSNTNRSDVLETSRLGSAKNQWVKIQGALPLSIFGGVEEEEEEELDLGDSKLDDSKKNGLNLSSNGLNSVFKMDDKVEQIKPDNELSLSSNRSAISFDLNRLNGVYNQFETVNIGNEIVSVPNGLNSYLNGLDSSLNRLDSSVNDLDSKVNYENEDFDEDDGWEFQGAGLESNGADFDSKVDQKEIGKFTSMVGNGVQGSTDLFVVSNGIPSNSTEFNFGFDFIPNTVAQNGFSFESETRIEQREHVNGNPPRIDENLWEFKDAFAETETKPKPSTVTEAGFPLDSEFVSKQNVTISESFPLPMDGNIDSDDFFGSFRDGNSDFESKDKTGAETVDFSHGGFDASSLDGQRQINKTMPENQYGALSLSLFSEENPDAEDSFNLQNSFAYKPTSSLSNGIGSDGPSISFDALILNLYSEAGKTTSDKSIQKPTINGLESIPMELDSDLVRNEEDFDDNSWEFKDASVDSSAKDELDSDLVDNGEDFDDNSWEFKDASADSSAEDQIHIPIADTKHVTKLGMESYTEFYTTLNNELYHIAHVHLDSLKKAKTAAALCGDDTKVGALDDDIKEVYKRLHQENWISEVHIESPPPRTSSLNDILAMLQAPNFQVLESEYHLSKSLSMAEKDMRSAIDVLGHAVSKLKLLTSCSMEEQSDYVSAWSRIVFICAQELKHGASIWEQALHRNVHRQVLLDPQGQKFIVALGEIYRVVIVIEASAKLYRPWMLSNLEDHARFFALLKECSALWSTSRLEEALQSMSDPIGYEYEGTIKSLLESINHVHNLDAATLEANLFGTQEPTCRLSALTPAILPDMKLVIWNGEHYFLKLASLWANLISSDPPILPHIYIG